MNNKGYFLPASILIAAVLISGSLIWTTGKNVEDKDVESNNGEQEFNEIEPITEADYIRGAGVDAKVAIVEYSDPECPFCSNFHETMKQVMENYGDQVAWVYRHFPLDNLHRNARKIITGTECANDLGGEDIFWGYLDRVYEVSASGGLNLEALPTIADYVGLNITDFNECLESGKFDEKIEAHYQDATQSGGQGTPYVLLVKDGEVLGDLGGAKPYEYISGVLENVLNEDN